MGPTKPAKRGGVQRRRNSGAGRPRASTGVAVSDEARFAEVVALIESARGRAYQAVNAELVSLYWQLGQYISRKIASAEWGEGVVEDLAASLGRRFPGQRGLTRANLFRMRQFFEAYRENSRVSPLVRQLPWTHHVFSVAQPKPPEFRPADLGQLSFDVEALVRDVKKAHEEPSMGPCSTRPRTTGSSTSVKRVRSKAL